jgi:hypothetical protein
MRWARDAGRRCSQPEPAAISHPGAGQWPPRTRNRHLIAGMAALVVAGIAVDVFAAPRTFEAGILGGEAEGKR